MKKFIPLAVLMILMFTINAQVSQWVLSRATQQLLKNIEPGGANSNPQMINNYKGHVYFWAATPSYGIELWRTDGTPDSTVFFNDINPGAGNAHSYSNAPQSCLLDSLMFFSANDGVHGEELWRTDGTVAGTYLLKDIYAGSGSSSPSTFFLFNGKLFFVANDSVHGSELWMSDGTDTGTVLFKDIEPGTGGSGPSYLYPCPQLGKIFFTASTSAGGTQPWVSDGTPGGTKMLLNIAPGSSSDPLNYGYYNGYVYFSASDGNSGWEAYRSDGTTAHTGLFKDLNPGWGSSFPNWFTSFNGKLYFSAYDANNVRHLWVSDGTPANTAYFTDTLSNTWNGINGIYAADSFLLLFMSDAAHGYEPWITRGTPGSTFLAKDTRPGAASGVSTQNAIFTDSVYTYFFVLNNYANVNEIWATDGMRGGTFRYNSYEPFLASNLGGGDAPIQAGDRFVFPAINVHDFNAFGNEPCYIPKLRDSVVSIAITTVFDTLLICDYRFDSLSLAFHAHGNFLPGNQFILCSEGQYNPTPIQHDTITGTGDSVFNISLKKLTWPSGGIYFYIVSTNPPTRSVYNFYPVYTYQINLNVIPADTMLCADTINLNASAGWAYSWNTGATTQGIHVDSPGYYHCLFTVASYAERTCYYHSDTAHIVQGTVTPLTISATDTVLCLPADSAVLSATATGHYHWNNGDTTQQITVRAGGLYSLTVDDGTHCGQRGKVTIRRFNVPVGTLSALADTVIYSGDSLTGNWYFNGAYVSSFAGGHATTPLVATGWYEVRGTYGLGCPVVFTDSFYFGLHDSIAATEVGCSGGRNGSAVAYGYGGAPPYRYRWSTGDSTAAIGNLAAAAYYVTVTDSALHQITDSVMITVPAPLVFMVVPVNDTLCGLTAGLTAFTMGGTLPYSHLWQTGDTSYTLAVSDTGWFSCTATDAHGCTATDSALVARCPDDVWPGDANSDLVCNNLDILFVGVAFGDTGAVRPLANLTWTAQRCAAWNDTMPGNVNRKHADTNGDGVVTYDDTLAINLNYGLTHTRGGGQADWRSGAPVLYVNFVPDTFAPGSTVLAEVRAGDASTPVLDFYGVAFTFTYDKTIFAANSVATDFSFSDMGTAGQLLSIAKSDTLAGQIQIALTQTDHVGINGIKKICRVKLDVLPTAPLNTTTGIVLSASTAIDHAGYQLPMNEGADSAWINIITTGNLQMPAAFVKIYPNPAKDVLMVSTNNLTGAEIKLFDELGSLVYSGIAENQLTIINTAALSAGVYGFTYGSEKTNYRQRVVICR